MFEIYIRNTFILVIVFSGIPLLVSSVCGLVISIMQAATQIQEQSLSYLVKSLTVSIVFYLLSNFYASESVKFFQEMLGGIERLGRM